MYKILLYLRQVLVFSDPAVDVLNEIGVRTGIPNFYISFILAPLASNASELVATYKYACKKTASSMVIGLSTLEGAGIMNNTFCLAIFYALIWTQRLSWNFSAEILIIVIVELLVGLYALKDVRIKEGVPCNLIMPILLAVHFSDPTSLSRPFLLTNFICLPRFAQCPTPQRFYPCIPYR